MSFQYIIKLFKLLIYFIKLLLTLYPYQSRASAYNNQAYLFNTSPTTFTKSLNEQGLDKNKIGNAYQMLHFNTM